MATTQNDTKVVTGKVRLSYAHLFEPYANDPKDDPKYSVTILIPKTDKVTLAKIEKATKAAAEAGKHTKFEGSIPKNLTTTLHDGDEEGDLEKNPELEGHYYMAISSNTQPGIVDRSRQTIVDSSEVYSGCYALVSMGAFPFNYKGKKGVSFGLNHVMKVADGDSLGGRSRAEDDFADVELPDDDEVSSLI